MKIFPSSLIFIVLCTTGLASLQAFQQGQQPGGMTRELALEKLKVCLINYVLWC